MDVTSSHHLSTFAVVRAERRAILTRAASAEAERQAARERRDWPTMARAELELGRLWRRFGELGDA